MVESRSINKDRLNDRTAGGKVLDQTILAIFSLEIRRRTVIGKAQKRGIHSLDVLVGKPAQLVDRQGQKNE